jgi:hypothetical protein
MRYSRTMASSARTTVGKNTLLGGRCLFHRAVASSLLGRYRYLDPSGNSSSIESEPARGDPFTTALLACGKNMVTPPSIIPHSHESSLFIDGFLSFSQVHFAGMTAMSIKLEHLFQTCHCKVERRRIPYPNSYPSPRSFKHTWHHSWDATFSFTSY